MTRKPGDPARGDQDFGPLGGLADDVYFSVRDRDRQAELDARRHMTPPDSFRTTFAERLRRRLSTIGRRTG